MPLSNIFCIERDYLNRFIISSSSLTHLTHYTSSCLCCYVCTFPTIFESINTAGSYKLGDTWNFSDPPFKINFVGNFRRQWMWWGRNDGMDYTIVLQIRATLQLELTLVLINCGTFTRIIFVSYRVIAYTRTFYTQTLKYQAIIRNIFGHTFTSLSKNYELCKAIITRSSLLEFGNYKSCYTQHSVLPFASAKFRCVLFFVHFMLIMGISLNACPWKIVVFVFASGNIRTLLKPNN